MRLFIEPTEPLLFRTGRPFDAGENNFAETLFPPTPETIQGAVRTAIATHWKGGMSLTEAFADTSLTKLIGVYNEYGRFRITGYSLGRRAKEKGTDHSVERLFPAPAHVLEEEGKQDKEEKRRIRLMPRKLEDGIKTNQPDGMQLLYPENNSEGIQSKLEPMKGWLTERGLHKVLWTKEELNKYDIIKDVDIYVREPRLGIGMNNATKTTAEGLLYQILMIRMNHKLDSDYTYGFVVDIGLALETDVNSTLASGFIRGKEAQKLLGLPDQGWITLGGERRAAYFEVIDESLSERSDKVESQKEGSLLYVATPAALNGGWQPGEWKTPVPPIAAAIQRYESIGGWQMTVGNSGGTNKSMRRCVPAGSVYFFDKPTKIDEAFTDYGQKIGYGITYTGEWKR